MGCSTFEPSGLHYTGLPQLLGSTNPGPIAVHMEPFSAAVKLQHVSQETRMGCNSFESRVLHKLQPCECWLLKNNHWYEERENEHSHTVQLPQHFVLTRVAGPVTVAVPICTKPRRELLSACGQQQKRWEKQGSPIESEL